MTYMEVRQQLFLIVQKAVTAGLVRNSTGNFSMRTSNGYVAITPSNIKYDQLKPEEITIVDLDGKHIDGLCKASSETPMHTTILRNLPHVGAVCHTHSPYAMTFAVVGQEIPMVNTELLVCGAPIPVAEWTTPGTAACGELAVEFFKGRPELKVVLLRNHGTAVIGENIDQAFAHAYDVEIAAQVYYQALQVGSPIIITPEQVKEIYDLYRSN